MHHVTSAKVGGQRATDCQRSAGLTEDKWCLVNKLNYCFNSCSLIKFAERRILHRGTEHRRNDGKDEEKKKKRRRGSGRRGRGQTPSPSIRPSHYVFGSTEGVTTLTITSQDWGLLPVDGESSFCLSAKCNQAVLYWVGPGHQADSLPWHQPSDNAQRMDLNSINWCTNEKKTYIRVKTDWAQLGSSWGLRMVKCEEIFWRNLCKLIEKGKWESPSPMVHPMNLKNPEWNISIKFGLSPKAALGLSSVCSLIPSE